MSLKWELEYHEGKYKEAREAENTAFHSLLKLIRSLGGTDEQVDQTIGLWVDGTMASNDRGWHRRAKSEVEDKIEELRSLIDMDEDAELLK